MTRRSRPDSKRGWHGADEANRAVEWVMFRPVQTTRSLASWHAPRQATLAAKKALFAALYEELHRLAQAHIRRTGGPLTLSATTLLHEAYLDIAARDPLAFPDRNRFLGYASRAMRGTDRGLRAAAHGAETGRRPDVHDAVGGDGFRGAVDRPGAPRYRAEGSRDSRSRARGARGPEVLLRILLRRDRGHAATCRTGRFSATGPRRARCCTTRCARSSGAVTD